MSATDDGVVTIGDAFPKIKRIEALENFLVLVTWAEGRPTIVDLAPSIMTFKLYAPLRTDPDLFKSVHVVDNTVIAWGEDDAIDMHVSEVERLAGEAMVASDFMAFMKRMDFTRDATAAQLGISRRMVGYYAKGHEIPRYIALACKQIESGSKGLSLGSGIGMIPMATCIGGAPVLAPLMKSPDVASVILGKGIGIREGLVVFGMGTSVGHDYAKSTDNYVTTFTTKR